MGILEVQISQEIKKLREQSDAFGQVLLVEARQTNDLLARLVFLQEVAMGVVAPTDPPAPSRAPAPAAAPAAEGERRPRRWGPPRD